MQSPGGIPSLADVPQSVITAATLMPSSSRPLTEEPRAICLRHDRNQIKKRCTCGKARRYRPGRGYAPAADDARARGHRRGRRPALRGAADAHAERARRRVVLPRAPARAGGRAVARDGDAAAERRAAAAPRPPDARDVGQGRAGGAARAREPERRRGRRRPRPDGAADRAERRPRGDGAGHGRAPGRRAHPGAGLRRARAHVPQRAPPARGPGGAPARRAGARDARRVHRRAVRRRARHAMACYALAAVCAGDREAAEAAAKLGAPALVDHARGAWRTCQCRAVGGARQGGAGGPGRRAPRRRAAGGPQHRAARRRAVVPPAWTPGAFRKPIFIRQ